MGLVLLLHKDYLPRLRNKRILEIQSLCENAILDKQEEAFSAKCRNYVENRKNEEITIFTAPEKKATQL